ncbi:MAG TPA: hypothetical protein VE093_46700 [Polyangiaceae bacterium]|nr:hypothetical protein [Polyangiaceae bacterium]
MNAGAQRRFGAVARIVGAAIGAAIGMLGCDAGGLLEVDSKDPEKPVVKAHSANELVNGGTRASNGKYKVFYVVGQPAPQQGVATSPDQRVNGGLTGAVHGE